MTGVNRLTADYAEGPIVARSDGSIISCEPDFLFTPVWLLHFAIYRYAPPLTGIDNEW